MNKMPVDNRSFCDIVLLLILGAICLRILWMLISEIYNKELIIWGVIGTLLIVLILLNQGLLPS
jgi:hypothetical protein